ncbi:MAG: phytanoyl-CoA dioxygenase family protein [Chloroflexi bacterium]|nr:phytanoyl-CoA dioxygenase family protein [Chloroflexota bacterium]
MESTVSPERLAEQLREDGFCVIPDVADEALLNKTRACVENALAEYDQQHRENTKAPGSLIDSNFHPELADLVGNPRALEALAQMGLEDIKFWKAVIISKPPGGPRLYWHQDCIMWQDGRAYSERAPMIFLMYYLEDTRRENGCLRLLAGSHQYRHVLHEMGEAHTKDINRMDNPDDPRFKDYLNEVDVPIKAGDLVVGDARMFHATHENASSEQRTVITIWFHPFFSDLQEDTQSWIHEAFHRQHETWPADAREKIATLIPDYQGDVEPMDLTRTPDERLQWPAG